jgi:hypothetical protein
MKKIPAIVTGLVVLGGALYFYLHGLRDTSMPLSGCGAKGAISCQSVTSADQSAASLASSSTSQKPSYSASPQQAATSSDVSDFQLVNLESVVTQKYAIMFSLLPMSVQAQDSFHHLLLKREQLLSSQFYDARSNEAEVAANLRERDEGVAEIDHRIEALLSEENVNKYHLLKDSTYEQAQMNSFYELAGAENSLAAENKDRLLLVKLEQKQAVSRVSESASDTIKNAAPDTRSYLIEKMHKSLLDAKDAYLRNAKTLLNEDQFNLLRDYEQQLFDERWQDITAGLALE